MATLDTLTANWLAQQCKMISGIRRGAVIVNERYNNQDAPLSNTQWPVSNTTDSSQAGIGSYLLEAAQAAIESNHSTVINTPDNKSQFLAYPITDHDNEQIIAAVCIETPARPAAEQRATLQLLQWGVTWLLMLYSQASSPSSDKANKQSPLVTVLNSIATVIEHKHFNEAATAITTELAAELQCERVGIGIIDSKNMQVKALSHSAEFGQRTNLIRDLASSMAEAVEQSSTVVYQLTKTDQAEKNQQASHLSSLNHEQLLLTHGGSAVCTVPLSDGQDFIGAITFERSDNQFFASELIQLFEHIASLIGPILGLKAREDSPLLSKVKYTIAKRIRHFAGPKNLQRRLWLTLIALLIIIPSLTPATFRVNADAVLEGTLQRAIVAPQDGFIGNAHLRAGDTVTEGDLLANLDDRELRLEYLKWSSQQEQYRKQYRNALAADDRAEANVARAQMDQAQAQADLLQEQIQRTQLLAPFDGFVVSGDLSQALGSPVSRGDILFEVAPLDSYRIALSVDEQDIALIQEGQQGQINITSLPGERYIFKINRITPVATLKNGKNQFRVEAEFDNNSQKLRPGMQGVGKIEIGNRQLIWIWTRKAVIWLRLFMWKWLY